MSSGEMSSGSASGSEENPTESNKPVINASGDYLKKSEILAALQVDEFEVRFNGILITRIQRLY